VLQTDITSRLRYILLSIQFIKPTIRALQCNHDRYTIFYMFRHFLSVIIGESLYRLKWCTSNWSVKWGSHSLAQSLTTIVSHKHIHSLTQSLTGSHSPAQSPT